MHSFSPFCALLRSFADLRLRSFALICELLRVSASDRVWTDRVWTDRVWELQKLSAKTTKKCHPRNSRKRPENTKDPKRVILVLRGHFFGDPVSLGYFLSGWGNFIGICRGKSGSGHLGSLWQAGGVLDSKPDNDLI